MAKDREETKKTQVRRKTREKEKKHTRIEKGMVIFRHKGEKKVRFEKL